MESTISKIIYNLVPPVFPKLIGLIKSNTNRFKGDYLNWKEVLRITDGYCDGSILTAVQESTRKVVRGEAKYERDQILFNDRHGGAARARKLLDHRDQRPQFALERVGSLRRDRAVDDAHPDVAHPAHSAPPTTNSSRCVRVAAT